MARTVANVMVFLKATMGIPQDGSMADIVLDDSAHEGFDFILNQTASLSHYASTGVFFDIDGLYPYGSQLENPYKEKRS